MALREACALRDEVPSYSNPEKLANPFVLSVEPLEKSTEKEAA